MNLPVLGPFPQENFGEFLGPILLAVHQGAEPVLDPALRLIVDPVLDAVCGAGIVGETLRTDFDTPRGMAGPVQHLRRPQVPVGFQKSAWGL